MFRASVLILLLLVAPLFAMAQGTKATAVVLKDWRGRQVRLSDYKGRVVLLNFWAEWCPPCRAEIPDLVRWQRQYRSRGLQIVGITYPPTDRAAVRQFMRLLQINYPVLFGTTQTKARFEASETLPVTVIIDRDGSVREVITGVILPEEFATKIEPLLKP